MSDEKKNVVIGIVLALGAVAIIFLLRGGSINAAAVPLNVPDATATPDPGASYTSYNLAPYGSNSTAQTPAINFNSGCDCNSCGPLEGNGNPPSSNINQFNSYI